MKIVIAPDSFKECLPAHAVAEAIAVGVRRVFPHATIELVPLADGGEGTVDAMVRATGGTTKHVTVTGPMGATRRAEFGILGDGATAVVEMAAASGLDLVPRDRRNPLVATTYGTGELIRAAMDEGVDRVIIGIGGSATNDGGAGMAQALGYSLFDAGGHNLDWGGGSLGRLARIDSTGRDKRLDRVQIDVACDVTNPLTGPKGASAVYGPQKGATPAVVDQLDQNLRHYAEIVARDLGVAIDEAPGAGAAGGLGGGLMAFCRGKLQRGIELMIHAAGLKHRLNGAAFCITGEGSVDHSSQFGKTAVGVAKTCQELGVPTIVLAGGVGPGARAVLDHGVSAYFDITPRPCTLEQALAGAADALADTAEQVVRLYRVAQGKD